MVVMMAALVASAAPALAQESAAAEETPGAEASSESAESSDASEEGEVAQAEGESSDEGEASEEEGASEEDDAEGEGTTTEDDESQSGEEGSEEASSEEDASQEDAEEEGSEEEVGEDADSKETTDEGEEDESGEDEGEDPFAEADRLLGSEGEEDDDPFDEPFEMTWGGRVEAGWFFTDFGRFNEYVLEPNGRAAFDDGGATHIDLAVEAMFIRGLRLSVTGGASFNWGGEPSVGAWYIGLEPAYAVGDNTWEMAVGLSAMVGSLQLAVGEDEMNTSLTVLRPFFEVSRHFPDASSAVYLRAGFNQWHIYNPTSDTLNLEAADGGELDSFWLSDGGFYLAIGGRFGKLTQPEIE
ncbi:hypothetical protein DV096_09205 [Bradymonadaceae bacterium TMQ3]|uniref:Uncharacterized protein n=1 Tax=Lujinxingia sediminis TaxID=2480984 RepID=A0ABY0CPT7_9DELT|nr:hypothetical protein [Lujinxingia sediminis]RDV37982.1 hypothetical protein DV096_09205 [Bradymonadaceae bacterium TMQ3]RVU42349.1 hypothetical protein EA187_17325 [Lujinxingia sediminis]